MTVLSDAAPREAIWSWSHLRFPLLAKGVTVLIAWAEEPAGDGRCQERFEFVPRPGSTSVTGGITAPVQAEEVCRLSLVADSAVSYLVGRCDRSVERARLLPISGTETSVELSQVSEVSGNRFFITELAGSPASVGEVWVEFSGGQLLSFTPPLRLPRSHR